jgi:hypothetical protein
MAFNPPTGNVTGLQSIYSYINGTVGGFFFMGITIAMFIIIFIKLLYNSNENGQAFTAAAFLTMIVSILLRVGDLVPTTFMVLWIIATAGGAVWMHYENARFN